MAQITVYQATSGSSSASALQDLTSTGVAPTGPNAATYVSGANADGGATANYWDDARYTSSSGTQLTALSGANHILSYFGFTEAYHRIGGGTATPTGSNLPVYMHWPTGWLESVLHVVHVSGANQTQPFGPEVALPDANAPYGNWFPSGNGPHNIELVFTDLTANAPVIASMAIFEFATNLSGAVVAGNANTTVLMDTRAPDAGELRHIRQITCNGVADSGGNVTLSLSVTLISNDDFLNYTFAGTSVNDAGGGGGGDANAPVTGVQGTGAVGTVSAASSSTAQVTGVQGTGAVGTVTAQPSSTAQVTGVQGTGAVGTVQARSSSSAQVTGVQGTGTAGAVQARVDATAQVTGVQGTGAAGTVSAAASSTAQVTGVQGTGAVGSPAARFDSTAQVTGVSATGAAGSVTASTVQQAEAQVTGVQGTGAVGSPSVRVDSTAQVTGVSATGAVSTVSATSAADAQASVTGVQGTGAVGSVSARVDADVQVQGVQGTGAVGTVQAAQVGGEVTVYLEGVSAYGQVGTVTATDGASANEGGGMGAGPRGRGPRIEYDVDRSYTKSATVMLEGVSAYGQVGPVQARTEAKVVSLAKGLVLEAYVEPVDATVELVGVEACGRVGMIGGKLGKAMRRPDPELEAFVLRVAAGGYR